MHPKTKKPLVRRTTVRLRASQLEEAKRVASKSGMTLTELIDEGLDLAIKRHHAPPQMDPDWKLPVGRAIGGDGSLLVPIDFNNSAQMWEAIEELERQEKRERQNQPDDSSRR